MILAKKHEELKTLFSLNKPTVLNDGKTEINFCSFIQKKGEDEMLVFQSQMKGAGFCSVSDDEIQENREFVYPVFRPVSRSKSNSAIFLLHGLNERSWEKYLTWADYLCRNTGRAVILFPIAFHMNRTPGYWTNPRYIIPWVMARRQQIADLSNSTFVNMALSSRLSEHPVRLYISGRESAYNIWQLVGDIVSGGHLLFEKNTQINIFAYSIGALLSQVLLLANPDKLFDSTKLFMFCGGSIFKRMNGNARDIMDKDAFSRVQDYFMHTFTDRKKEPMLSRFLKNDTLENAFRTMLKAETYKELRESFFEKAKSRIHILALQKDMVMPTNGIHEAVGDNNYDDMVEELDFPFQYSHQNPFPLNNNKDSSLIDQAFQMVFGRAASFLA
ncbi:MAG: DUF6051 family protein [Barnesiella sp.]